jgi:atypical dual specificity phosphatase
MNFIIDNIYLGDENDSKNYEELKKADITHILIAAKNFVPHFEKDFSYLYLPIYDSPYTNLSKFITQSNDFISESQKSGKNILIHCGAGISRSASLVIAYLISVKKMTYTDAKLFLKQRRKIINPNEGFEKQLINLSYSILNKAV